MFWKVGISFFFCRNSWKEPAKNILFSYGSKLEGYIFTTKIIKITSSYRTFQPESQLAIFQIYYLSIYLSIHLSIYLSIYLSISIYDSSYTQFLITTSKMFSGNLLLQLKHLQKKLQIYLSDAVGYTSLSFTLLSVSFKSDQWEVFSKHTCFHLLVKFLIVGGK